ncbi:MAG: hypothetical protein KTR16_02125 [Acidiferrobacterales bacterium]|nr:hypothetical protein [Acidiferrobacterales bacterium]
MNLSKMPKPLIYAMSIAITAIGLSIAYQIVGGSEFGYSGPLGEIVVGKGNNQTTLDTFLSESEDALKNARVTISEQESIIARLKTSIEKYKQEVIALQSMTKKLNQTTDDIRRQRLNATINQKVAALDASVLKATEIKVSPQLQLTQKRLIKQEELTRDVRANLDKK